MSSPVVKLVNCSTIAVVGALATGLVASVQIHYGNKAFQAGKGICDQILRVEKDLESIKDEMTAIKEEMVTKEDVKNFVNGIARQNPCLENAESIFPRARHVEDDDVPMKLVWETMPEL